MTANFYGWPTGFRGLQSFASCSGFPFTCEGPPGCSYLDKLGKQAIGQPRPFTFTHAKDVLVTLHETVASA